MTIVTFNISGTKEICKLFSELEKKYPFWSKRFLEQVAKSFQDGARRRAPEATGFLKKSIKIQMGDDKEIRVTVDAPYAAAQEYGFEPHIIPIEFLEMGLSNPGMRMAWYPNPTGFVKVSKHTPFVMPAFESLQARLPQMAEKFYGDKIRSISK